MTIDEEMAVAAIPGLRFRHYAGPTDIATLTALEKAANLADAFQFIPTVEQTTVQFEHPDGFDPAADVLIGEVDGRPVAAGMVRYELRGEEHSFDLHCDIHPDFRRRGIGTALLHANEARARERARGLPAGLPIRYGTWAPDTAVGLRALMESDGYAPIRYFFEMLKRDLESPALRPLPDGLELRPLDLRTLRRAFDAENEAFRDHWGHHEFSDELFAATVVDPDLDLGLWRVAWEGDEVAGVVSVAIYREENEVLGVNRGWLDRISVRRPWRNRGLAAALVLSACDGLRRRGVGEAALGVDAENPHGALGLYERLGFVRVQRATAWGKALALTSGRS